MRLRELLAEAGETNAGSIASVPSAIGNKPGKGGKAPKQFKVKSVSATNSNVNIFGAVGENQAVAVIKR
jgi:hypothetical protein